MIAAGALSLTGSASAQADQVRPASAGVVTIDTGSIAGEVRPDLRVYRGIPYVAPPVGPLRWRPPRPAPYWDGTRDATRFGPACPQRGPAGESDITRFGGAGQPTSEDCLTLNVWAPPAGAARAAVMVWLHGGSGRMGAGSLPYYDGSAFARDGVIMVTINYRLGHLGAFAHPALSGEPEGGNYALMDQIAALQWVKRNIAAFGGDPGNITIIGQSAGGISVFNLIASPTARGLFHRAVIESAGGWFPPPPGREKAHAAGIEVARAAGAPANATAAQLRALPAEAFAKAPGDAVAEPNRALLPESPTVTIYGGWQARVPLLIGVTDGEDSLLDYGGGLAKARASTTPEKIAEVQRRYGGGLSEELALRYSMRDGLGTAPARWVARHWSRRSPVYLYRFQHIGTHDRRNRAPHGAEIFYVFKTLGREPGQPLTPGAADLRLADAIHARWVAFARTGNPNVEGLAQWPAYSADGDPWMVFAAGKGRVEHHILDKQLDWYDGKVGWLVWLAWIKAWFARWF
ncbi:carboxylesterase/lipase family protein [Sphingomonas sp. DT-204]|uniref:carboxylesterase/lipase family protein n=1 Tax=Sphingomonas sp. DT-204 TaxID=3396166 RepID=UPI003F19445A